LAVSTDKYWVVQLDEESSRRSDQSSFHVFAEGQHSDLRGQIYNLDEGGELSLPHDSWPRHLFVAVGIHGIVDAHLEGQVFPLRAHSQMVILPGTPCKFTARSAASIEIISILSMPPRSTG
jgi:hypothetical protein